eukprot:7930206-Prorocentrum_lima.AAC.1
MLLRLHLSTQPGHERGTPSVRGKRQSSGCLDGPTSRAWPIAGVLSTAFCERLIRHRIGNPFLAMEI